MGNILLKNIEQTDFLFSDTNKVVLKTPSGEDAVFVKGSTPQLSPKDVVLKIPGGKAITYSGIDKLSLPDSNGNLVTFSLAKYIIEKMPNPFGRTYSQVLTDGERLFLCSTGSTAKIDMSTDGINFRNVWDTWNVSVCKFAYTPNYGFLYAGYDNNVYITDEYPYFDIWRRISLYRWSNCSINDMYAYENRIYCLMSTTNAASMNYSGDGRSFSMGTLTASSYPQSIGFGPKWIAKANAGNLHDYWHIYNGGTGYARFDFPGFGALNAGTPMFDGSKVFLNGRQNQNVLKYIDYNDYSLHTIQTNLPTNYTSNPNVTCGGIYANGLYVMFPTLYSSDTHHNNEIAVSSDATNWTRVSFVRSELMTTNAQKVVSSVYYKGKYYFVLNDGSLIRFMVL